MKRPASVILIVIILALLFVSNPTTKDFSTWYGNQKSAAVSGGVGKVLGGLASAYNRQSYGIFSVFSLTKGGAAYLGMAKVVFIKVK
jgi:hypothetical protein